MSEQPTVALVLCQPVAWGQPHSFPSEATVLVCEEEGCTERVWCHPASLDLPEGYVPKLICAPCMAKRMKESGGKKFQMCVAPRQLERMAEAQPDVDPLAEVRRLVPGVQVCELGKEKLLDNIVNPGQKPRTIEVPVYTCAHCRSQLGRHLVAFGERNQPEPGDLTICGPCGAILQFGEPPETVKVELDDLHPDNRPFIAERLAARLRRSVESDPWQD